MVSNWSICSRELNQKGYSFFPRNIQFRARPKGTAFQFVSVLVKDWLIYVVDISKYSKSEF